MDDTTKIDNKNIQKKVSVKLNIDQLYSKLKNLQFLRDDFTSRIDKQISDIQADIKECTDLGLQVTDSVDTASGNPVI